MEHRVVNTESHRPVEECMLAANEAVGELLETADSLFLRCYERRTPAKSRL